LIFVERCDLPPSHAIPQAVEKIPPTMSRGADGRRTTTRHQTATLGGNPRWTKRYAGDRLNHPRYRDFATIPEAVFFQ
jgi:hypothetical protein